MPVSCGLAAAQQQTERKINLPKAQNKESARMGDPLLQPTKTLLDPAR
jgi:hypothetical protein